MLQSVAQTERQRLSWGRERLSLRRIIRPPPALESTGIPKDSILKYETSLEANKFLLVVHGTAEEVEKAGQILKSTNATETNVQKV